MMLGSTKLIPGDSLLLAQSESESMGMKLGDWLAIVQEKLSALRELFLTFCLTVFNKMTVMSFAGSSQSPYTAAYPAGHCMKTWLPDTHCKLPTVSSFSNQISYMVDSFDNVLTRTSLVSFTTVVTAGGCSSPEVVIVWNWDTRSATHGADSLASASWSQHSSIVWRKLAIPCVQNDLWLEQVLSLWTYSCTLFLQNGPKGRGPGNKSALW